MSEITHSVDERFLLADGSPYRVTDYKLYSTDFHPIQAPILEFDTSSAYELTAFHIKNRPFLEIIDDLRHEYGKNHKSEYAHIVTLDKGNYFQTENFLTGESGIGFKVADGTHISDYFHTHSIHRGEDEEIVNLFSADDLYATSSKSIDRIWLVTPDNVWVMINLYGNRYYYAARDAYREMELGFREADLYDVKLAKLITAVQKCEFRLYNSTNGSYYTLLS